MSLFNFNNDQNEPEDCSCAKCSHEKAIEMVTNFTEIVLQSSSEEELFEVLFDMFDLAKVEGVKDYLFESIGNQEAILEALSSLEVEFITEDNDEDYDGSGSWLDRF